MKQYPNLDYEIGLWEKGYVVIGVDEVGRGAIAGPIFAVAMAFKPQQRSSKFQKTKDKHKVKINDSKKLTAKQRQVSYQWLINNCLGYYQASISVNHINKKGIAKANKKVMRDAVYGLIQRLKTNNKLFILTDYIPIRYLKNISKKQQINLIKGDQISLSIAASSIIAKVLRDMYICRLSRQFPKYFWHKNKGYGTKAHLSAIKKIGICKHHRKKFCHI